MNNKSRIQTNSAVLTSAPIFRRFAALVYDTFIVFSWLLLATTLALIVNKGQSLLAYQWLFLTYLFISTGLFLSWFWTNGQTLGMLAWKLKVTDADLKPVLFRRAFVRYCVAFLAMGCAGVSFWWCFIDKDKQSLHDRLTKTRVITLK